MSKLTDGNTTSSVAFARAHLEGLDPEASGTYHLIGHRHAEGDIDRTPEHDDLNLKVGDQTIG
ncbi:MAG: hypothetical protein AAF204_04510 [Pseudomonadota bacterium]